MKTLEELKREDGNKVDLGVKILITYALAQRGGLDVIRATANTLSYSIMKALYEGHKLTWYFDFEIEDNKPLKAWEDYFIVPTEIEWLPEQYLNLAQQEIMNWERMSLLQYLKYWLWRKFRLFKNSVKESKISFEIH